MEKITKGAVKNWECKKETAKARRQDPEFFFFFGRGVGICCWCSSECCPDGWNGLFLVLADFLMGFSFILRRLFFSWWLNLNTKGRLSLAFSLVFNRLFLFLRHLAWKHLIFGGICFILSLKLLFFSFCFFPYSHDPPNTHTGKCQHSCVSPGDF